MTDTVELTTAQEAVARAVARHLRDRRRLAAFEALVRMVEVRRAGAALSHQCQMAADAAYALAAQSQATVEKARTGLTDEAFWQAKRVAERDGAVEAAFTPLSSEEAVEAARLLASGQDQVTAALTKLRTLEGERFQMVAAMLGDELATLSRAFAAVTYEAALTSGSESLYSGIEGEPHAAS